MLHFFIFGILIQICSSVLVTEIHRFHRFLSRALKAAACLKCIRQDPGLWITVLEIIPCMLQSDAGVGWWWWGGCPQCSGSHKLDLLVWFNEPRRWSSYTRWVQSSCWTFPALVTVQISLGAKTCSNSVLMGSLRLCLWTLLQISHGIKDGLTLTRCWWGHPGDQLNLNESRLLKEMARLAAWARPYIPGLPHSWGKDVSPRGTRSVNHKKQSLTRVAFWWTVKSNSWGFVILL